MVLSACAHMNMHTSIDVFHVGAHDAANVMSAFLYAFLTHYRIKYIPLYIITFLLCSSRYIRSLKHARTMVLYVRLLRVKGVPTHVFDNILTVFNSNVLHYISH